MVAEIQAKIEEKKYGSLLSRDELAFKEFMITCFSLSVLLVVIFVVICCFVHFICVFFILNKFNV